MSEDDIKAIIAGEMSNCSSDDLVNAKRDAMASDLGRRRRTRSRGSFGAITLILQQVKRQVQKNIQELRGFVH